MVSLGNGISKPVSSDTLAACFVSPKDVQLNGSNSRDFYIEVAGYSRRLSKELEIICQ